MKAPIPPKPRILPVLDLMGGLVVRGVAGKRKEYRPVEGVLAASPQPGDVAAALRERFGFQEAYVADLDAIAGGEPDWRSYDAIHTAGLKLWLDMGVGDVTRASQILRFDPAGDRLTRLIIGLESLARPDALPDLVAHCGAQRLVFSLDMKAGLPLTKATAWQDMPPEHIAAAAVARGITSLILLDLGQVGMYQGTGTEALCRK